MKLEQKLITIDGPSASGKGLASRNAALDLGFRLLDSGLLYRAYGYLFFKYDSHDQTIDAFNKLGSSTRTAILSLSSLFGILVI